MKRLRVFVLLLLVLLLPLRGVMAATMLCGAPSETSQTKSAFQDRGAHAHHMSHAQHGDISSHAVSDHAGLTEDGKGGDFDKCNLCASDCSATPLATAPPEVISPLPAAKVVFRAVTTAIPAFQSEGPERPPRSI